MWWWHSAFVVGCFLTQGTQAFAPIMWMQTPTSGRTLMPKGFKGWAFVNTVPPQELVIGSLEKTSSNSVPYFAAKMDNSITWDDTGWCIEASGRASGDAVRVNQCNGDAAQKWNWIPDGHGRNMIQLKNTNKCLDVKTVFLHEASVELRDCASRGTDAWKFEESHPLPKLAPATSFGIRQTLVFLLSIAGVSMLSLGAWMWWPQNKARVLLGGQGGMSMSMCGSDDNETNIRPMANARCAGNVSMMAGAGSDVDASKTNDGVARVQSALAAGALATVLAVSGTPAAMAVPGSVTKFPLEVKSYAETTCPPELAQGRAGGALGAGAGGNGIAQKCVTVKATVSNPSDKTLEDVGVFGRVTGVKDGMSVLGNGQDGKNDTGQYAIIPKIPPGDSELEYVFVAQQATACINTRRVKCPIQGDEPLRDITFEKTKAVAYAKTGEKMFKLYDECEQNAFAEGCD